MKAFREVSLKILAAGVVVLMGAIVLQVVCSALDINPLASFQADIPLLGKAITLNSLLDFQWHILVIIGLVPAGLVWLQGTHVRVDFLYNPMTPQWKARIDLAGNLLFAVPFFFFMLPASTRFMLRAWTSDEASRNGGLNDLWLIKSILPVGLFLLALAVLVESLRLIRTVR
ncbi:MAG: TRAP transporter small permease subunit [Roseibium album]|uniref:TRAP transporter small permease protein n=1 Tax=Roseibium album TaxID=311410 RepID=A0A0M7AAD1_9HYPH|nr:TRAP transporter small permease subunit [Roseibium album]MBG6165351.1 TRAP-type mannitol/chloroaromatic compound transport system permease small subunit [Labrenzia sp. EL_195]MBG6177421.1 TRAP-type mannitol/chloroaromatic compound transport system permease small subunit [Labrenzia sp. EL_132]MBG6204282.1 TRAP-type mannitol/chloroaromatic compound transport system permease small subunit [Labrenzia sp. EL_13]MBG6232042.1 TRAP-type mannitol/chloroaromatic compound transport system permease smal